MHHDEMAPGSAFLLVGKKGLFSFEQDYRAMHVLLPGEQFKGRIADSISSRSRLVRPGGRGRVPRPQPPLGVNLLPQTPFPPRRVGIAHPRGRRRFGGDSIGIALKPPVCPIVISARNELLTVCSIMRIRT
jgi:hypothetical protein